MDLSTHAAVVNCEAYRDGRKIAHFDIDKVGDFLGDPDCFVWIGLAGPDSIAMQALQSAFGLHELAVEDAQGAHERPKLEEYGDTLFMVMHTATLDGGAIIYGETHVFLGPRFIITVRHGASAGYAKLRERKESVPEKLASGPGYVLYSIIDFIVDQYQPCIDHLQSRFQHYELQLFQPSLSEDKLQDFYQLKTELLKLDAAVNPLHDICTQLIRFHGDIVPKENRIYYRDILDHVKRVTHGGADARTGQFGHAGGAGANLDPPERGGQAPGRLGRHPGRADHGLQPVRHELRIHAGTEVARQLSGRDRRHHRRLLLAAPAPEARGLAVASRLTRKPPRQPLPVSAPPLPRDARPARRGWRSGALPCAPG